MKQEYEFTDRYKALGIAYPNPETMCAGPCEGLGIYPQFLAGPWLKPGAATLVNEDEVTPQEVELWHAAHSEAKHTECDGWHFIKCSECNGTGKAAARAVLATEEEKNAVKT